DPFHIGAMAGRQLPLLSLLVPFWLVFMMDGAKGVRETWPAALVCGGSFAVTQFFTSNHIGPELPDITSALVCLAATTVFLKFWHPKRAYAPGSGRGAAVPVAATAVKRSGYTAGQILKAWSPFIILTVVVVIWTLPGFRSLFNAGGPLHGTTLSFKVPGLHEAVINTAPIVGKATPYAATYKLDLIAATGSGILLAAVLSMLVLGISARE